MNLYKLIAFIVLIAPLSLFSNNIIIEEEIHWNDNVISKIDEISTKSFLSFTNVKYDEKKDFLGFYSKQIVLNQEKIVEINIIEVQYEDIDDEKIKGISGFEFINDSLNLSFINATSRKINYGEVNFTPIIYNSRRGQYQRVIHFKIQVITNKVVSNSNDKAFTTNSVLETGDWYKIAVLKDGIFKLSYNFLKELGLDVDNLNPANLKLYGNGGKMLPTLNSVDRADDIQQNAILIQGESDGSFDSGDYVLFYGQSPHTWSYNTSSLLYEHQMNKYSDTTYYYLTFSNTGESPKRIVSQSSQSSPTQVVSSFDDYAYYEKDLLNLIKSGDQWFGEIFDIKTSYNFVFNFPNIDVSTPVSIKLSSAARSSVNSNFTVSSGSSSIIVTESLVNTASYSARYANLGSGSMTITPTSDIINVTVNYNKPTSESIGWLDEIELNTRRNLIMSGEQLFFRDLQSVGIGNISTFNIGNAINIYKIWEITDPFNIKEQQYNLAGSTLSYSLSTDSLREFVAFTTNYETQVFGFGKIENQNLHAITQADMVIVSHPNFLSQAAQLADFHTAEGLSVIVVTPQQIYNEFSSGSPDIVAVRDFLRMLYERNSLTPTELPKYLLLFGDGSYDNKDRIVGNTNFILSYQTPNSIDIIGSLVSDDYYGLLDINEGTWAGTEYADIGIGRLPVKSQEEADNVVNKILSYNTPSSMNEWRNRTVFVGDDGDNNTHMSQSNSLAAMVESGYQSYNVNKIFLDAFKQETTAGGNRYPEVNLAINDAVDKGSLIVNYTGHGGETGWAHERILTVSDINNWSNTEGYPLFITATCEFSRWDDPKRTSAGELVLLSPNGGIGLLTTVRLVFSGPNFTLNQTFFNEVFDEVNNEMPTIGDVFLKVKNANAGDANNRNFTLLGDPALKLAYPIHEAITTKINEVNVSANDTIKALSKVTIAGIVQDENGQKLTNYNGVIYPIVFDKKKQIVSLSNDGEAPFSFNLQTSKLFKGKVSVTNGDFSYTFIVPKDIAYNYGKGKLSYYAENQVEDANGYYTELFIGGTSDNYEVDNTGPAIDLYMNDENFVFGGITDENPILFAKLNDIHGINMVGNGIGHDIIAVLDDKTEDSFILNDYYEADLNSYQNGKVYFPFKDLTEGRHKLTLKVWDVYNNSSEAILEFVVVKTKDITLDHVYNYPNPFTTHTEFWFEHNQPGKQLYAQVQIYTVSGKLVKTLEQHIVNEGYRSTSITWDGLDEYGDKIGRGVYVYRLKVRTENFSVAEKYEKLVILR